MSWARQLARGPAGVLALVVVMLAMVDASSPESAHARAPTRLVAIGDYGIGGPTQMQFGTAVRSFASARSIAMLLTLGDNDYSRNTAFDANWQESFGWVDQVDFRSPEPWATMTSRQATDFTCSIGSTCRALTTRGRWGR